MGFPIENDGDFPWLCNKLPERKHHKIPFTHHFPMVFLWFPEAKVPILPASFGFLPPHSVPNLAAGGQGRVTWRQHERKTKGSQTTGWWGRRFYTGWWFGTFVIFPYIESSQLTFLFFRGVGLNHEPVPLVVNVYGLLLNIWRND